MRYKRELVIAGRDISENFSAIMVTIFAGLGGWATAVAASMREETMLYGNVTALMTAIFVAARICKVIIDIYYDTDSRELIAQKLALHEAKEAFYMERKRLDEETARLDTIISARAVTNMLESSSADVV